jgi:predicted dehydrogenase
MGDDSWEIEFAAFLDDIRADRAPSPSYEDAAAALAIVERVYAAEQRA